jgi:hypothetical protein
MYFECEKQPFSCSSSFAFVGIPIRQMPRLISGSTISGDRKL